MKKYKIGIPAWKTGDNSFGVTAPYMQFIESFDAEVIILNPHSPIRTDLDLLLIPGGPDVDTMRYNQAPGYFTGKPCPFREYFDINHLPKYIEAKTPIYGICRGFQSLGVYFGASMRQHVNHVHNESYDRSKLVHEVDIDLSVRKALARNLNFVRPVYGTNSIHHQVLREDTIMNNTPLVVVGRSDKKHGRHVELIAHPELPIVAEQAHPEETYNPFALAAIRYLLENKKSILS